MTDTIRWCLRCGVGVGMAHLYPTCPNCGLTNWIDNARADRDDAFLITDDIDEVDQRLVETLTRLWHDLYQRTPQGD